MTRNPIDPAPGARLRTLAGFLSTLQWQDLPAAARERAALIAADEIGNLVAGRFQPTGEALASYLAEQGGRPRASIPGLAEPLPLPAAALANATNAHSIEQDDTHNASSTHVGAAVVSAALATAEANGAGGPALLTAVAAGIEAMARLGMALGPVALYRRGYHPSSFCAPFGTAAAVGKVYGYGREAMLTAFSLAGVRASGVMAGVERGPNSWYYQYGRGAQDGVLAAELATRGFAGPPEILEGERGWLRMIDGGQAEVLASSSLAHLEVLGVSFKLRSCLHFGQAATEALLRVMHEHGLTASDITHLRLRLPNAAWTILRFGGQPETRLAAQSDPRYLMAVAAIFGNVSLPEFAPAVLRDPAVQSWMDRVEVVADEALSDLYPARWPAAVDVSTTRGGPFTAEVRTARGDADNPPTWDDITAKFRRSVSPHLSAADTARVLELVTHLPELDSLAPLTTILRAARPAST